MPLMNTIVGGAYGAAATAAVLPFATDHTELDLKLLMVLAPDIVFADMGKVYGFRTQSGSEGYKGTICELHMGSADYNSLMNLTELMLSGLVKDLTGGYKINYHANGLDKDPIEIDFTPPFRRIDMIEELEKIVNLNIPDDLSSEETVKYLSEACTRFDIKCPPPQTTPRLLDKLVGHFLKGCCVNPTFIMSPLAKWHRSKPGQTEQFELLINKHEIC